MSRIDVLTNPNEDFAIIQFRADGIIGVNDGILQKVDLDAFFFILMHLKLNRMYRNNTKYDFTFKKSVQKFVKRCSSVIRRNY